MAKPLHILFPIFSFLLFLLLLPVQPLLAQQGPLVPNDSLQKAKLIRLIQQKDLFDLGLQLSGKDPVKRLDSAALNSPTQIFVAPGFGYTQQTGFAGRMKLDYSFMVSRREPGRMSHLNAAVEYTQRKQFMIPIRSVIWSRGDRYHFQGDWRFLKYPQDAYGFGGHRPLSDKYTVHHDYLRFHQFAFRSIGSNFYAGLAYQLDYHWKIKETDVEEGRITDFQAYGFHPQSIASGLTAAFMYDNRSNAINQRENGWYARLAFRQNSKALGSDTDWNSLSVELRRYFKINEHQIIALRTYNVFTPNGNPPYLDLPGTATDTQNNTGRGYIQDRFVGKNMLYAEGEYRFDILRNGLLGGVVFANAQSLSELDSNRFEVISPALGFGIRIKFNKLLDANISIDYGFGTGGARGASGMLGEAF